jgi:hypothetical protein
MHERYRARVPVDTLTVFNDTTEDAAHQSGNFVSVLMGKPGNIGFF